MERREAGCDEKYLNQVVPACRRGGNGSCCEIQFDDAAALQAAKISVRILNKEYQEGRRVWLDAKKERSELWTARCLHKAAAVLDDIESKQDDAGALEKNVAAKTIKLRGNIICWSLKTGIRFGAEAMRRYSPEDMETVRAYAESD